MTSLSDPGFKVMAEACAIFAKYNSKYAPFSCEHDILYVHVNHEDVSEGDKTLLEGLGFDPDDNGGFSSYRFGSS